MDDLLSYLDSVQIDVVKRKYYNANKVNAVFEEIRNQAEQLVSENQRLQTLLNEKEEEERSSAAAWSSVQETYREILIKAHDDRKHQERNTRKIMINISSSGNKYPGQILCEKTDQNE